MALTIQSNLQWAGQGMERPEAFLFDMDGLLLDSERVYRDVAIELMRPMGFDHAQAEAHFMTLVGNSGPEGLRRIAAFAGSRERAVAFNDAMHAGVKAALETHVPLRPMVREALAALARQGARMAVVTSTHGANARRHLAHSGLLDHFEFVVAGDEVRANKPDPAPYLQAAEFFGMDPRHCAAFEDSDPGTTSAVTAGCHTTQIPDLRPIGQALPDLGQRVAPNLWAALEGLGVLKGSESSLTQS